MIFDFLKQHSCIKTGNHCKNIFGTLDVISWSIFVFPMSEIAKATYS